MTESLTHIVEGPIGTEAIVIDAVAAGAIDLWHPVILAAAGTGEDLPRVNVTATANDPLVYGVVVGPKLASGKAADAAGNKVNIVRLGRCKCVVDGKTVNIAIGDALVTIVTTGHGAKIDLTGTVNAALLQKLLAVFATALKASTADGDTIPVDVRAAGGTAKVA